MSDEAAVADSGQDTSEQGGFDIDQASSDLAGDLFPASEREASDDAEDTGTDAITEPADTEQTTEPPKDGASTDDAAKAAIEGKPAPKTWPKEMHEHWGKTPKEVQDYWDVREKQMLDGLEQYKGDAGYGRQMRDAVAPYMALIQAQGIDAPRAVQTLLNAHYKLSVSSPSQKAEYMNYLAKQYGVDLGQQVTQDGTQQQVDPRLIALQDELHQLKQVIHSGSEQQLNAERTRISQEVDSFASITKVDANGNAVKVPHPDHPYFDEVADDIIVMLKAGFQLQDAYDRAVWANPGTRAKETARIQTEAKAESDKKAREQAEAAKKAASTNIRNRDTRRTPTEQPKGTMRDLDGAMKEAMREIKARTH